MKYTVHIGNKPIVLEHQDIAGNINVDDLTIINTGNIYGEMVTMSPAVNQIGLLRAEVEKTVADSKLELKFYEGKFKEKLRKQAANNSGYYTIRVDNEDVRVKISEKALESSFETDKQWYELKQAHITAERNFNALSALYWACQDKCRKLNALVAGTTPQEFVNGIVAGKLNGILIEK